MKLMKLAYGLAVAALAAAFLAPGLYGGDADVSTRTSVSFATNHKTGQKKNLILVDKSEHRLYLVSTSPSQAPYFRPSTPDVGFYFPVLLGGGDGDKIIRGDLKTPEGFYRLQSWIPGKALAPKYGIGAFPLSYPNLWDKIQRKTGTGIWIHGMEEKRPEPTTRGCIAMKNSELEELMTRAGPGTEILISSKLKWGSPADNEKMFDAWRNRLLMWHKDWERGSPVDFSRHFHPSFPNLKEYMNNKKSVWTLYPIRAIVANDIEIFIENEDEAVTRFRQFYMATNLNQTGTRTIFWKRGGNGEYGIVAQQWEKGPKVMGGLRNTLQPENKATLFLKRWKSALENQWLAAYEQCYHPEFKAFDGTDRQAWVLQQKAGWRKGPVKMTFNDVIAEKIDDENMLVSLEQVFSQGFTKITGEKLLVLRKGAGPAGKSFGIFREFRFKMRGEMKNISITD